MNGLIPQKPETSEKLKAKQYGAAACILFFAVAVMTAVRLVWGNILLGREGNQVPLGLILFYVCGILLLFGGIDLVSAIYHFARWNRNGRQSMEDDDNGLFSDWKSGERSPVKVSLVLMAGITALALLMVIQG